MIRKEESIIAVVSKEDNSISTNISNDDSNIMCAIGIGKGDKGDPGYTPQKGIDYFTEDDINSLELDRRVGEALQNELDSLLMELNNKVNELGLDIQVLKTSDDDIKKSINDVLKKIEYLARYSKGEIHPVNIY